MAATRMHRATLAGLVTGALVTTVLAGPAASTPAPAALRMAFPEDLATVALVPAATDLGDVQIADDAVYYLERGSSSTALWRRPITTAPAGTYLGAPTAIAELEQGGYFAQHEGTVAYPRRVDNQLVLRDASGTETTPAWGGSGRFGQGVTDLSDDWIVGRDASGWVRLFNRHTGTEIPLGDLAEVPAEFVYHAVDLAYATDTRVVWSMALWTETTAFTGTYTVALDADDPDGVVGPVTVLGAGARTLDTYPATYYSAEGVDGDLVVWSVTHCETASSCGTTLSWYRGAPYTGPPAELDFAMSDWLFALEGTTFSVVTGYPAVVVEWYDLAGAASTPTRTLEIPGYIDAINARFVVYTHGLVGGAWFSDATGAAVSDQGLPTPPFSDVRPGDAFYADIVWLVDQGITGGYSDGTFRPGASVNRDAMAAFLYRMDHDGARAPSCTTAAFTDVPASHPFCGEIAWLASTGITTGWPDGTFRPSQAVTREAMAAFLYRFDHGPGRAPACTYSPFGDVLASHPFCGEIAWMAEQGISTGWVDGTFRPSLTIERQAMAAFLHRFATRN